MRHQRRGSRIVSAGGLLLLLAGLLVAVVAVVGEPAGATAPGGAFVALGPARVLDTRIGVGGGVMGPNSILRLAVAGRGGVPSSGVAAVVLNVTVTQPTARGYLTVWADGTAQPGTSNLNFSAKQTVPNVVIAPVGGDGQVAFFNGSTGRTQVIADVSGYYRAGAASTPGAYTAIAPARVLDTRLNVGGGVAGPGAVEKVRIAGLAGVPAAVGAVVLNLTVTGPTGAGYLAAWADGTAQPTSSNLNFSAGQTVADLVVVAVGADGEIDLANGSTGSTQLIADVGGYFLTGTPAGPGVLQPLAPGRIVDTRAGLGGSTLGAHAILPIPLTGAGGVAPAGVSAVILTVTVTRPAASGYLTVWPDGTVETPTSNVNFSTGQTVANLAVVPVGSDGAVDLINASSGPADVLVDVGGFVLANGRTTQLPSWGPAVTVGGGLRAVSCVSTSFCAAVGDGAAVYRSGAWGPVHSFSGLFDTFVSVSCVSTSFCMAITGGGLASRFDGTSWSTPVMFDDNSNSESVDCLSTTYCLSTDVFGYISRFDGSSWSVPTRVDRYADGPKIPTFAISCVSTSFCVGGGGSSEWLTFDGSGWTVRGFLAPLPVIYVAINAVSCVSTTFCVGMDRQRMYEYDGSGWSSAVVLDAGGQIQNGLSSVSCVSATFCATTTAGGDASFFDGLDWSPLQLPGGGVGSAVSCVSTSFCMSVGGNSAWKAT